MVMGHLRRGIMAVSGGVDVANLIIGGSCTFQDYGVVQMNEGDYRLLAIIYSGNLVPAQPINMEVCVVGGGANGLKKGSNVGTTTHVGGAGAYMKNQAIEAFEGGAAVVGAAQGASSIGGVSVNTVSGKNGGTGGGGFGTASTVGGTGDGLSKYPFGDCDYERWSGKPHCAGGAGGGYYHPSNGSYKGGNGGTNGSSGSNATGGSASDDASPGTGGSYGGGNGGRASYDLGSRGGDATYYGSGGGSQGYSNGFYGDKNSGSGYQGIIYVRIPVIQ